MFYCDECGKKNDWPEGWILGSYGPCELCGTVTRCNDIKSNVLGAIQKKSDANKE